MRITHLVPGTTLEPASSPAGGPLSLVHTPFGGAHPAPPDHEGATGPMADAGANGAVEWLASAAPDPEACRWEWERHPKGVALLPAGKRWDVLILPGGLGTAALDVLKRLLDRPGPVLADFGDSRLGFFVPPGTVARWLGTGVRGAGDGTWIVVPYPGRDAGGVRWLVPPDGSGTLTDPAVLEIAMHEAAAGLAEPGEGAVRG